MDFILPRWIKNSSALLKKYQQFDLAHTDRGVIGELVADIVTTASELSVRRKGFREACYWQLSPAVFAVPAGRDYQ